MRKFKLALVALALFACVFALAPAEAYVVLAPDKEINVYKNMNDKNIAYQIRRKAPDFSRGI